ncbi:MAG TPA: DUF222 domain-containing protein [Actinomycetaceae bacterium]|nr:DUF222 domain-containing protein [Actinomycetaceae bacterium]
MARDGSSEDAQPKARIDVIYPGPTSDFETAFGTFLEGLPRTRPRILVEQTASPAPSAPAPQSPEWARQKLAELEAEPEALSDYLEAQEPGPQLAQFLETLDLDAVDDYCLVEVVAAYKRMESWAAAGAMGAAAALAERPALNPTWPGEEPGRTRGESLAGHELAVRLKITKRAGARLAAAGRAFKGLLADTGQALARGLIDAPRATAIFSALDELPAEVAIAAEHEVIDKAPGRTLRQLQHDLAKAVIAVDPDEADTRHRAAVKKRRVHRPQPRPDGMALFSALLPAVDAVALDLALDSAARAAKHNGSTRTLDQLRADALALMGHSALQSGRIGSAPACSGSCAKTAHASTAAPSPRPGSPAVNETASELVSSAFGSSAGNERPCGDAFTAAQEPPCPGHRLPGGYLPWIRLANRGGLRPDVRLTIPLAVAMPDPEAAKQRAPERDPEPVAELEGYGPISPEVARALAAGGQWRRLVTDPVTQQVLNVGRTRYQPPRELAELVQERDATCVWPGCSTPAAACEGDHRHEWQDGGETSVWNLDSLCKSHHPIKTLGAYTVARASDGTYALTTTTGHGYLRRLDGTVLTLPRRTAAELRTIGQRHRRDGSSPAPETVDTVLAQVAAGSDAGGTWSPPTLPDTGGTWSPPTLSDPTSTDEPTWFPGDEPPF